MNNPGKLVTLMELLRFYAETYIRLVKDLQDLRLCMYIDESQGKHAPDTTAAIKANLGITKLCCDKIGLHVSGKHTDELLLALDLGIITSHDIKALHDNIERELSCRFYVGISEDRKAAFCESLKGWEDITTRFKAATEDVEEMNKCYALCRYSAAVFHSLLVMEHGLVALGKELQVSDPKEG